MYRLSQPLRRALIPFVALGTVLFSSCGTDTNAPTEPGLSSSTPVQIPNPGLSMAIAAQGRHTDRLLRTPGVVGTAVGLDQNGKSAVQIFTRKAGVPGLPSTLDGVPVQVVVTGTIRALPAGTADGAADATALAVNRTARFARPVPIGVSTGNKGECIAGTIGARVKSGSTTYALSNNHVYALQNQAAIGSTVLQPGQADVNCAAGTNANLGKLTRFVRITFSSTASNRVDAAIAAAPTARLGRATPSDGYGTPRASTTAALINQAVRKYGRTTGQTAGHVVAINATVIVAYNETGTKQARFVGQIVIQGNTRAFSRPGDSGSLIVDGTRRPVGLLFAGGDTYTFANRIGDVLNALNVSIDGL